MKNLILFISIIFTSIYSTAQVKKDSSKVNFGFMLDAGRTTFLSGQHFYGITFTEPTIFIHYKKWRIGLAYQFAINKNLKFEPTMPVLKTSYALKAIGKNGMLSFNMNFSIFHENTSVPAGRGVNGMYYQGTVITSGNIFLLEPGISYRLSLGKHFSWETSFSIAAGFGKFNNTYSFPTNPSLNYKESTNGFGGFFNLRTGLIYKF